MNSDESHDERVVRTICNSHCGGNCIIKVHVKGNRVIRVETDDGEEPQLRACAKGRAYRQRLYSDDRLLYPLKRVGKRGEGKFARITWDEALETVASNMKHVKDTFGPASILFFCSMADNNSIHHERAINRLLCKFGGYTAPWGTISNEGNNFAAAMTYGTTRGLSPLGDDLLNSRLIIMWGWNPATTIMGTNTSWFMARAKEKGAKIISVDPKYTDSTAVFAHQWIPIKPGTDTAVLIAMAYIIITENLHDKQFINKYTLGIDKFKDYLLGQEDGVAKTPKWAEAISGVKASVIVNLAHDYASLKPAALIPAYAPGRSAYGEQYHRAAITLTAITGNIGIPGGSPAANGMIGGLWSGNPADAKALKKASIIGSPPNPVEHGTISRWNALPCRSNSVNSSARVNVSLFADAILKGKEGGYSADYKFLWLSNNNYLNQLADVNKMIKALEKLDFVLVTEQFMTPTAKYADIVLPTCTYMERNDFFMGVHTNFFGLVNKVIEPLGESKALLEICDALSIKLGISDFNNKTEDQWIKSIVEKFPPDEKYPDYYTLKTKGIYRNRTEKSDVPFKKEIDDPEHNPFPTPSGKIEIYSETIARMNNPMIPPIPKYIEPWEGPQDPLTKKYPLQIITPHLKRRAHSQFDNIPWLNEHQSQTITISCVDAESRGIRDGDMVRIFNGRGEMIIPAQVTERIMPGVVDIPQGAWYKPDEHGVDRGGCANVLTRNVTSPAGAFCSNTALVQVEKLRR